jgi:hypothetical protein
MTNNLKITNMTLTGSMPFDYKLNEKEINKLVLEGELRWINMEKPMLLSIEIKKEGINAHGKEKRVHVSVWPTGSITIVGATKKKEAEEIYEKVLYEIKKLCPRVLKNVIH